MAKTNNIKDFFRSLAKTLRVKLNRHEDLFKPKDMADVISTIDSNSAGSFASDLTCVTSKGCLDIKNIIIFDGVKKIKALAYSNLRSLTSVTLFDSITEIEGSAFLNCSSLEEIKIPDSVKRMGDSVFKGCSLLGKIEFGGELEYLSTGCFDTTKWYQNLKNEEDETKGLVVYFGKFAYRYKGDMPDEITLKSDTVGIAIYAFSNINSNYENLKTVTCEGDLRYVNPQVFYKNTGIQQVILSNTQGQAITIGYSAFEGCSSLTSVDISNLGSIDVKTFKDCTNLKDIYFRNDSRVPYFSFPNVFEGVNKEKLTIHVRKGLLETWQARLQMIGYSENVKEYNE